jgi:hypothetical protein
LCGIGPQIERNHIPRDFNSHPIFGRRRELRDDEAALLERAAFALDKQRQLAAGNQGEIRENVATMEASEQTASCSHLSHWCSYPDPHCERREVVVRRDTSERSSLFW